MGTVYILGLGGLWNLGIRVLKFTTEGSAGRLLVLGFTALGGFREQGFMGGG